MNFILRTAWRETRSAWKRLVFFFVCIAIGVGAIVALRSVIQSIRGGIGHEARKMLGGDVVLSSNNPFTAGARDRLAAEQRAGRIDDVIETTELMTMARPVEPSDGLRLAALWGCGSNQVFSPPAAAPSSPPSKSCTGCPGTMVEMACL